MDAALLLAIGMILIAGIINGSFALATKNLQQWQFEHIWLHFSFWTFFLLPWLFIFYLDPQALSVYRNILPPFISILVIGGVLFGIGQVCFSIALSMVGFGLSFLLNIGLGTGLGFLLPLVFLHIDEILTPFGLTTLLGLIFIIIGLILSYLAGKRRGAGLAETQEAGNLTHKTYQVGMSLAIFAGICSGGQNFSFALTTSMQALALNNGMSPLAASVVIWPIFLTFGFIPYACYMLYLHKKNHSFHLYSHPRSMINGLFALQMGIFWYGSLILYSKASQLIGNLGPVVGWPLFMVMIIITSNFWGWWHKEWQGASTAVKKTALVAIGSLILAVIILGYSTTLSHS